ncbi:hypothetical protein CBM2637_A30035 [Cupriavidus taiwanensis]|nr:hypothetical protein CBM2637_A30035 [Cupriavidus taiwanensis]
MPVTNTRFGCATTALNVGRAYDGPVRRSVSVHAALRLRLLLRCRAPKMLALMFAC